MTEQMLGRDELILLRPRANTVQASRGRTSLVSCNNGVIEIDEPMLGLYVYDTRVLGRYKWLLNGKEPEFSCSSNLDQHAWMGYFIAAPENCKETQSGLCNPLLLGLYPLAPAKILFLDPHLPEWLPEITVERMRVGQATVTLRFYRDEGGATQCEVKDQDGTLHLVRQPSPWSQSSGWRERIKDAVFSAIGSGGKAA